MGMKELLLPSSNGVEQTCTPASPSFKGSGLVPTQSIGVSDRKPGSNSSTPGGDPGFPSAGTRTPSTVIGGMNHVG